MDLLLISVRYPKSIQISRAGSNIAQHEMLTVRKGTGGGAEAAKPVEKARILVVDDHPIVREGLAELINRQSDLFCCGLAGDISQAQKTRATQKPDLGLLDLR